MTRWSNRANGHAAAQPISTATACLGQQATATITIVNDDARVGFISPTYFVNENVIGGQATINRSNASAPPMALSPWISSP